MATAPTPHSYDASNRRPPGVCRCGRRLQHAIHVDPPRPFGDRPQRPLADRRPEPHTYEPGESRSPMQTDPACRVCGETKRSHR